MNWFKYAQSISVNISEYLDSLYSKLMDVVDRSALRQQEINKIQINEDELLKELEAIGYKNINRLKVILKSKNKDLLQQEAFNIYKQFHNYQIARKLHTLADKIKYEPFTKKDAEDSLNQYKNDALKEINIIKPIIEAAIKRIPNWNNSQVMLYANKIWDNEDLTEFATTYGVEFVTPDEDRPNFTIFFNENNIELHDILEYGDTDFFKDNNTQNDYFNLIQEIKNPGSLSQNASKILTLYTARPVKDRQTYLNATEIPSGIFLTSNYDSAEGIASDLAGSETKRDVWKVKIESKYLLKTMDNKVEQYYQAVGNQRIPIKNIQLIYVGE